MVAGAALPGRFFADYRLSNDDYVGQTVNLGGYLKYTLYDWDAATYLIASQAPATTVTWKFAGRLRYRFAEHHKIGLEVTDSLHSPGSPTVVLGYYGSLSDSLALNIFADPGFNKGPNVAAGMELVWQFH